MYELEEISFEKDINRRYTIEEDKAEKLVSYFKYLGLNIRSYYYYQIVKRNLNELVKFIQEQQNKVEGIDAIECNRLLFNYIDTLYGFINYFEMNYKENFKIVKQEIYNAYFEYRFIYNLRNFMIHEDLSILSITKQFYENLILVKFNVSRNKVTNSTRFQPRVREETKLKFDGDNIDIYPILEKQFEIIKKMQERMLLSLSEELLSRFDFVAQLIINNNETFLIKDGKIINGLLNVITKFYKDIADNFIYEENYLETKNSIGDLFMKLSQSYYKESNIIYASKKLTKKDG